MSDFVNIGVALVELEHAEVAALRAQSVLAKLVNASAATQADRDAFGVIAAELLATEDAIYAALVAAITTLPDAVAQPIVAQIPVPTPLHVPTPADVPGPARPLHGLGAVVVPPAIVWAVVVLAVLLAVVAAVAVVWALKVSVETITTIILTYRAAETYGDALQARVACLSAGRSAADCNASIILPTPPTPPGPPVPSNPATPWYVGGTIVGGLGALGLGLWFLERRAR